MLEFHIHSYSYTFSLKSIDLVCMKKLDTKVNIIPIIAKADTISKTELQKFKVRGISAEIISIHFMYLYYLYHNLIYVIMSIFQTKIISELQNNGIHIYQFPTDDESVADINSTMNTHAPFAVVGSTDFVRVGNKMMRSRQYPWGTVQGRAYEFHLSFFILQRVESN